MHTLPTNTRSTALVIARIRAEEARRPVHEQLFNDPYAALFAEPREQTNGALEALPFFREQVRLRSRFFDDGVRAALSEGIRWIVVVGAGFDTRALRLPELAEACATVIELDFADQLAAKWQRLASAGVARPAHVACAALNLSTPNLEEALRAELHEQRWDHGARVLWLCEGLVGYLKRKELAALASATFRLSGPGSRLLANHFCPVWNWEQMRQLLDDGGWHTDRGPSFQELHRRWIGEEVPPGSDAFALVSATR